MKHSEDGSVHFDAKKHTYTKDGRQLQGVTSLISKFKQPFDKDGQALKYAIKNGLDKDAVLAEWEAKGKAAIDQGNAVHQIFEDYILQGHVGGGTQYPKQDSARRFIADIFAPARLVPVEAECIVHNDHIASMIDCIARDANGNHYILDWKTNKDVSADGWGRTMLPPFDHLPDATFYHYSLQLSFYRLLLKKYEIKEAYIVHIKDDGYDFIKHQNIFIPDEVLNYVKPA